MLTLAAPRADGGHATERAGLPARRLCALLAAAVSPGPPPWPGECHGQLAAQLVFRALLGGGPGSLGLVDHVRDAEARTTAEAAVDTAERIGESYLLPGALITLALIALHQHDTQTARSALTRALAITKRSVASENGVQGVLTAEELACQALLTFLHESPAGRPGRAAALAAELARLDSTVQGTARKHLEPVLSLSRGLSRP